MFTLNLNLFRLETLKSVVYNTPRSEKFVSLVDVGRVGG